MQDREKLKAISTLRLLLEGRDQFIEATRFRGREWARLLFFVYYSIWSEGEHPRAVVTSIVRLRRPNSGVSDRQARQLKEWDEWITTFASAPQEVSASFPATNVRLKA